MTGIAMVAFLTLAACARTASPNGPAPDPHPDPPSDAAPVAEDYAGRFRAVATVLESPEHGPQICAGVDMSLPPQCSGPDIVGWDWATVTAESVNGTSWGSYLVVGTWDGAVFTLTEPAVVAAGSSSPQTDVDFSAPCPEPAGGWQPVDPVRAGQADLDAATTLAQQASGYAGLWLDQRGRSDNDPGWLVLVVRTTGDPDGLESDLRGVWGGNLCVTGGARYSEVELRAVQQRLGREPGVHASGVDTLANRVDVGVYVATEERQRELDARFGPGMVRLHGLLQPVD